MDAFEANNVDNLINVLELVPKVFYFSLCHYAVGIILIVLTILTISIYNKLVDKSNQDVNFLFSGGQDGGLGAHSFWLANCSDTFKVTSSPVWNGLFHRQYRHSSLGV